MFCWLVSHTYSCTEQRCFQSQSDYAANMMKILHWNCVIGHVNTSTANQLAVEDEIKLIKERLSTQLFKRVVWFRCGGNDRAQQNHLPFRFIADKDQEVGQEERRSFIKAMSVLSNCLARKTLSCKKTVLWIVCIFILFLCTLLLSYSYFHSCLHYPPPDYLALESILPHWIFARVLDGIFFV